MLAGIGRQLVDRHAQSKRRVGLEEDVRSAERDAVEERSEQGIEKFAERRRLPTSFGNETMGVGERQNPRLVFCHQVGQTSRILRRLREQGQQLREKIAGAVAQLADHQLMALIKLSALDGARQDVRDGCKERHVVVIELAPPGGMRAEHAIGTPVTSRDRRGQSAHDAVPLQQRLACEPRFGRKFFHDHRTPGG